MVSAAVVRFETVDAIFATLKKKLTINEFFSAKLEKRGHYLINHPVSNPEPLLPNIPLIPLHYQVDPPISLKI